MKNRKKSGAALFFVAAALIILVMIGVCVFTLSLQMGGNRELLNATDSGSLNVAKQAIRNPDVPFPDSEEALNFSGIIDQGQVSLANYNRIVGQTLLVTLNAEAEGTPTAKDNAEKLINMVQGGGGIAASLRNSLSNASNMSNSFSTLASLGSVKMLGGSALTNVDNSHYQVAYLEPGTASNVDFDPQTLPYTSKMQRVAMPAGATVNQQSSKKLNFISGYTPIAIPGFTQQISGVPVNPGQNPHLVSQYDFANTVNPPAGVGIVPPNSFRNGGAALAMHGIACSVVGAQNTQFTAAIPHGYLVIHNGPATSFSGVLGGDDQIFAQELMTGIFVGPGSGNNRAFTTDASLYNQWLNYNTARAAGTPVPPPPSSSGIYGNPLTITAPATMVTWLDYNQPPTPLAGTMLGAFQDAYSHANTGTEYSSNQLTAVELFKAKVIQAFGKVTHVHDPSDPAYSQNIPAPTVVTGMKAFNHGQVYSGTVAFGQPGSVKGFLEQCGASSVLDQIQQRLYQINPDASEAERQAVLNTACIGMGQTYYIYKGQDNKLTITPNAPSWVTNVKPDGKAQNVSEVYSLIRHSVDAPHDGHAPLYPFEYTPNSEGTDAVTFTPSSGYTNLLGEMNFSNSTQNGGQFWDPN